MEDCLLDTYAFGELKSITPNNGFEILPLTFEHTNKLITLNFHHKDPFDRLIIAQALTEKLSIISKDLLYPLLCKTYLGIIS